MEREELCRLLSQEAAEGDVTVLVRPVGGETLFSYLPENQVVSASTVKTPLMLCALEEVRSGRLSLTDEISVRDILSDSMAFEEGPRKCSLLELIAWSIVDSDNTAANVLIDLVGMENFNAFCQDMGWTSTRIQRKMLDWNAVAAGYNNITSAVDQYKIFSALWQKTVLTPELCELSLGILRRQRTFTSALRYLPLAEAAHKTGGLNRLRHDCGLFLPESGPCYFGFFISNLDDTAAEQKLGRMGRTVWQYLTED